MKVDHAMDLLEERADRIGSRLVVGIDPHLPLLPANCRGAAPGEAADGVLRFATRLMEATTDLAVAVKPQSAFFERLGWRGWRALEECCRAADRLGLPVILDAKRGDIGSTSEAYAAATLDPEGLGALCVTVNPYLGPEGLSPFVERCRRGKGIFVLVRTTNPGAPEIQGHGGPERPLFLAVARMVERLGADRIGRHGLSSVGAVAAGTDGADLAALRAAMAGVPFLVPGFGAQGAGAADVAAAFRPDGRGAYVAASRSIAFAWRESGGSEAAWDEAARAAAIRARDELNRFA